MANTDFPRIVCDVDVPRDEGSFGMPTQWLYDSQLSWSARGVLLNVVSYPRGTLVTLNRNFLEDEPPAAEVFAELVGAGYLTVDVVDGSQRYRLVHPARFEPLPAV
jgi:hypothetical protein